MKKGPKRERRKGVISKKKLLKLDEKSKSPINLQDLFDNATSDTPQYNSIATFCDSLAQNENEELLIPHPPIKQIAFQGGGNKGAAYPGAGEALEEYGYLDEIDIVAGASAGAITAFIFGLGFSGKQFKKLSDRINFLDFTDVNPKGWGAYFNGYGIGNVMDLIQYGGAYTGEAFHQWAMALIEQILGDPNATFADLHNARKNDPTLKDLIFKATRYNARFGEIIDQTFSYQETPNIRIADALRASMAFPIAFTPYPVKDKEGRIFGVFADGGILSNYPIDELNKEEYFDPHYSPIPKKNPLGREQFINPCVLGFNLVSDLGKLNEKITPMTERLKQLRAQNVQNPPQADAMANQAEELSATWRFNDILKAQFWHRVGMPIREIDMGKKVLFNNQTVQIWTENVKTLEFDAPSYKIKNIFLSGKNATLNWLNKFRDPTESYVYPDQYDDRLSSAELDLKKTKPKRFYTNKLTDYYEELIREMTKLELQNKNSDELIKKNVRLRFISTKIKQITNEMKNDEALHSAPNAINKMAFERACKHIKDERIMLKKQQERRWQLVQSDKIVDLIAEKLLQSPEEGLRLLKGQGSNIISLVRTVKGSNLLSLIVQTNDVEIAKESFNRLKNAMLQCYYQGRQEDIKYSLPLMLNELANPPIFSVLAVMDNPQMVKLVLQYGADPLQIHPKTGINGLQEMIQNNNYDGFKAIVEYCRASNIDLSKIRLGTKSIMHYILDPKNYLNPKDDTFLKELYNDRNTIKYLLNYYIDDENNNNIILEAARVAKSSEDIRWKLTAELTRRRLNFDDLKKQAQKNFKESQDRSLLAHEIYETIDKSSNPEDIIRELDPQICYTILYSYVKGELRLCQMAKDPSKADIFIALCERIREDPKVFRQLQEMLKQKINGKTALYYAAEGGSEKLVTYLRQPKYDLDINHAGPLENPCALLIAAKMGNQETVSALMKSIPWGLRLGYNAVSRRQVDYQERKTPLHYLSISGKPETFCDVLYGGGMRSVPSNVATMKDIYGKTPLTYIIEYNRMDILEEMLVRGRGRNRGYLFNSDCCFDDIFGWQANSNKAYPDLELAKTINPKMYAFLCDNLSSNKLKKSHIIYQVECNVALRQDEKLKNQLQTADEVTKMECSKLGTDEYDDYVVLEDPHFHHKLPVQRITPSYETQKNPRSFTSEDHHQRKKLGLKKSRDKKNE